MLFILLNGRIKLPVGNSEDGINYAIGQAHITFLAFCEGSMEICGHGFRIYVLATAVAGNERSGQREREREKQKPMGSAL